MAVQPKAVSLLEPFILGLTKLISKIRTTFYDWLGTVPQTFGVLICCYLYGSLAAHEFVKTKPGIYIKLIVIQFILTNLLDLHIMKMK